MQTNTTQEYTENHDQTVMTQCTCKVMKYKKPNCR